MKKINDDIARALEKCSEALSLHEFSRITGVRMELLRRFLNKRSRIIREETWDKIYPVLKPYLTGPKPKEPEPVRIGNPYRRHHDLVEMVSDQKVLLDIFEFLSPEQQDHLIQLLIEKAGNDTPSTYESLSVQENRLMGAFEQIPNDVRLPILLEQVKLATAEVRKRRKELF